MNSTQTKKHVAVIGAGISGLTTAFWLQQKGIDVTVLEKDSEVGGTMKTTNENGWLVECGPNSALETTPLFNQLFSDLGILDERIYASESSNKRYILRDNILHPLPMNLAAFLKTKLWSVKGKLRLLKEPFIGRAEKEESIAEFVERRLGREFLDYAINPFVAGVYAGNPEDLSVRSAFPKLYALEEKYGGLIKGMIKGRKERKQRAEKAKDSAKMFSFKNGMQTLPRVLSKALGEKIRLNANVINTIPTKIGDRRIYVTTYQHNGENKSIESDAVVLAVPSYTVSKIIEPIDPGTSKVLNSIYYPPVAEIVTGYKLEKIKRDLDGFGYLIPTKEKRKILGTIWSSTIYPNRAPEGYVSFTTFVGGSRNPEMLDNDDDKILDFTNSELKSIIGIEGEPDFVKIMRWDKAIPQYRLGYYKTIETIERFEQNFPGAFVCSNYRGGIAVGDCVMSADKIVYGIIEFLK
ncbi:MAG: protoporphyrinogen oxidase [Bacteroidota bacterium]|nr:protoporphyrinogen oxidase [Bacteroidota bacterium]